MLVLASYTLGLLASAWVLQVGIWRTYPRLNTFKNLLLIFFGVLAIGALILFQWLLAGSALEIKVLKLLHFSLCYGLLSLSYISFYSLIQGESPSIAIVMMIREFKDGLPIQEAINGLDNEDVVGIRLKELERDGFIVTKDGSCQLTASGVVLAGIFDIGRRVFGLPVGG